MSKKLTSKQQKEQLNNLFAVYNKRLGRLYSDYVKKLTSLGYGEDVLEDDALFNFDNFPQLKARLDDIFNDYYQNSLLCYKSGIIDGVALAYNHDEMVIGGYSVLTDKAIRVARDTAAATFISNRLKAKNGLNLAQIVWNYCQQTKSEFEMAMSNTIADGIGKGSSAEEIGKSIRRYLNDPDMMYRRYHTIKVQKNGKKKDVVTWRRRRIIDGKVRFIEEPLEKVGMGVYRSARKNALRVARTEINAAYHKARNERWKNEPFVIGQYIHVSPQHNIDDICNDLEGRYPKDYVWISWHPNCYAEGTQVLTKKGWKVFKDVEESDEILSLNPQTKETEYTGIEQMQKYPYKGKLVRFYNKFLECLVTPEHQMVYKRWNKEDLYKCNASDFSKNKGGFYRTAENNTADRKEIWFGDRNISFDLYCEFMGYYLADGSMMRDYGVVLSQKEGEPAWEKMQQCIRNLGFEPHIGKEAMVMYHRAYGQCLLQYGKAHDKFIPQEILNASKRQIQIFLDAFVLCDGSIRKPHAFMGNRGNIFVPKKQERAYYTTSPQMAADIGVLLLRIGHRPSYKIQYGGTSIKKDGSIIKSNYPCYRINECYSATSTVFDKEYVDYEGYVYDLTLEKNHIMYIQKDGKCFWGSNCMCTSDPITIQGEEKKEFYKRLMAGEDMSNYESPFAVLTMPEKYNQYIRDNSEAIVKAGMRGKLAWHLQDNTKYWAHLLSPSDRKKLGLKAVSSKEAIAEVAKVRHAKRDAKAIQKAWTYRRMTIYEDKMDELRSKLTYSKNILSGALAKRYEAVYKAIQSPNSWSVANIEYLYKRFADGIAIRERWDKLLWDGFSKEQITNCRELEKKLGILKGRPMNWERADQQNANPNYLGGVKNGYQDNCATCSPTYMLRLWGFNVTARNSMNPAVDYLSHGVHTWEKWLNKDGSKATWVKLSEWKDAKKYKEMTALRYKEFINETCREEGVYEMCIGWSNTKGDGHSTIIQRFKDGSLKRVDAQVYYKKYFNMDEKKALLSLCQGGQSHAAGIRGYIWEGRGIMRIDDKLFNLKHSAIFEVVK